MSINNYLLALLKKDIETVHVGPNDVVLKARIQLRRESKKHFGFTTDYWVASIIDSKGDVLEEWDTPIGDRDTLTIDNIMYKITID